MTTGIIEEAKQMIMTGTAGAGRLSVPQLDAILRKSMRRVYADSEMAKIQLEAIDEVVGQSEYVFPSMPDGGYFTRLSKLVRYDLDRGSKNALRAGTYEVAFLYNEESGEHEDFLVLSTPSSAPNSKLYPTVTAAFETDDYVPSVVETLVRDALVHQAERILSSQTGKPWTSQSKVREALIEYNRSIARIRSTIIRGGVNAGLKARVTGSFL